MRSIWESLCRLLEAGDDDTEWKVKQRLKRAHASMAAQGKDVSTDDQARRDKMARVMQDPEAARLAAQPPEDWEDELPGQVVAKGAPEIEPEPLPKPDQPAPGTASGIGAGRIAAKNATPTSVALGAKARRVDPNASGIKGRYGVTPDAFFGNVPLKVDPKTGKLKDPRGRPKKSQKSSAEELEASIDKLKKLRQNPKTDRHAEWLDQRIKEKEAELQKLQSGEEPDAGEAEFVREPFAAQQAAAVAKATAPKGERPNVTSYNAGPWSQAAQAVQPKGGEVRSSGKGQNVGKSTAGASKLTKAGDVRSGEFHGQQFTPHGYSAPDDDEWADNPELAARRLGGQGGKRLTYGQQATGQRGRMTVQPGPGVSPGSIWNKHAGEWQSPEDFEKSNSGLRAQLAAKLAMRGADAANRMSAGRRPWAGTPEVPGQAIDKSANAQKANAKADAIASKPLNINTRRDPESGRPAQTVKGAQYKPEPTGGQSASSTGGSGEGPVDRNKMKQMIAQRLAAMAAKKKG